MQEQRIKKLEALLAENPLDTFALYGLAMEYAGLNQNEKSKVFFFKVLEVNPTHIPTHYQLALQEMALNQQESAIKYLKNGLKLLEGGSDKKTQMEFKALLDELQFD